MFYLIKKKKKCFLKKKKRREDITRKFGGAERSMGSTWYADDCVVGKMEQSRFVNARKLRKIHVVSRGRTQWESRYWGNTFVVTKSQLRRARALPTKRIPNSGRKSKINRKMTKRPNCCGEERVARGATASDNRFVYKARERSLFPNVRTTVCFGSSSRSPQCT